MRRITLLLMVMATALLAASGVAWAVTKSCNTGYTCQGTNGADVLKGTSKNNLMVAEGGNDTYTNFARGNSGGDVIKDTGGRDKLLLTNYRRSEVSYVALDQDEDGKADSLGYILGVGGQDTLRIQTWDPVMIYKPYKNALYISDYFDDTRSKPPYVRGSGYIESILVK